MIEHGSEDDETVANNASAWSRYALVPRVLRDVNGVDTSTMVLGHRVALPVLAGPASFHDRVHPEGEIAVARGVSQVGGGAIIQGRASQPLPLIIDAAAGAPCFFQLYTAMDADGSTMDRTYVRKVLEHAASLGFLGVFVTVDTPNTGNREKTFGSPQWSVCCTVMSVAPIVLLLKDACVFGSGWQSWRLMPASPPIAPASLRSLAQVVPSAQL
jgi:isopentenyl diphosphate isomerase/L-lactate dehydrogenase-like FMN-dependent dehydrogenase